MWDQLSKPWQECLSLAWESYCEGSIPIGASLVDSAGTIVSAGRNRYFNTDLPSKNYIAGGPIAHAEINALLGVDWENVDRHSLELYTTVEPCPLCIGAICMSGVKTIRYGARDVWSGSINLLGASPYMKWKQIRAIPPENPTLETIIHILQVDGQLSREHPRAEDVLSKWSKCYPDDVRIGRDIFSRGELLGMKERSASVEEVIEYLAHASYRYG